MSLNQNTTKSITILGSTGSIGQNTLNLISQQTNKLKIVALTANTNIKTLVQQAKTFNAKAAVIADESLYKELKKELFGTNTKALAGKNGILQAAQMSSDIVMSAIVGTDGLLPTITAIQRKAHIALANKECLVCAGKLLMQEVTKHQTSLIPVDSEHNAIFQILANNPNNIDKIILTASGGPFLNYSPNQLLNITPQQATKHPTWNMGAKISIDSATMMNKGLEIIEAYHLFPISHQNIDVIIHPESIIHSMVEYIDGSTIAQLGPPDMRIPISVALFWPSRQQTNTTKLSLAEIGQLTFHKIDHNQFPAIPLAYQALKQQGIAPIIFNSANEVAVEKFLNNEIKFTNIIPTIEQMMQNLSNLPTPTTIEDTIHYINEIKIRTQETIQQKAVI